MKTYESITHIANFLIEIDDELVGYTRTFPEYARRGRIAELLTVNVLGPLHYLYLEEFNEARAGHVIEEAASILLATAAPLKNYYDPVYGVTGSHRIALEQLAIGEQIDDPNWQAWGHDPYGSGPQPVTAPDPADTAMIAEIDAAIDEANAAADASNVLAEAREIVRAAEASGYEDRSRRILATRAGFHPSKACTCTCASIDTSLLSDTLEFLAGGTS
jgi:hypothetical protein